MNEHPLAFGAEIYEPTPSEQTWKASGLSSNMADYFDPGVSVIVGQKLFS